MQLERNVDVCNKTKTMAQDRVCLNLFESQDQDIFKKNPCNVEKNEAASSWI